MVNIDSSDYPKSEQLRHVRIVPRQQPQRRGFRIGDAMNYYGEDGDCHYGNVVMIEFLPSEDEGGENG